MSQKKNFVSRMPLWVRILAIVMAALTASGALTYAVLFLIELFSH